MGWHVIEQHGATAFVSHGSSPEFVRTEEGLGRAPILINS
jgi:hypothetical protein